MATIDGSHVLPIAGGGGLPLKSSQKIDAAPGAWGTIASGGNQWAGNLNVTINAVDPNYSVCWITGRRPGALVTEYQYARCYVSSATTAAVLLGPYGSWFPGTNIPQYDVSLWVYEFEPSAVRTLHKMFWQGNSSPLQNWATPITDLSKLMFFDTMAWYRTTTPNGYREGHFGFWTLSTTQVRFSYDEYPATGGITHHCTQAVELM